jgi:hypothetical protein
MKTKTLIVPLTAALILLLALGGTAQADFGITAFNAGLTNPAGTPEQQAGAHPDLTTLIRLKFDETEPGKPALSENVKDLSVHLPPGLVGNPRAASVCSQADLAGGLGEPTFAECPVASQVGTTKILTLNFGGVGVTPEPVYNVEPPAGVAAEFGFTVASVLIYVDAHVTNDGGYRLEARLTNVPQELALVGAELTLWGVPADPVHDALRYDFQTQGYGASDPAVPLPFITNPTSCSNSPLGFSAEADSWQHPGVEYRAATETDVAGNALLVNGCEHVPFAASLEAQPTSHEADSPTGLAVTVKVPQNQNPNGLAVADLKDVTVTLPAGMAVNPASAAGLGSCSPGQIELEGVAPAGCADNAKIGTVEIQTPLLEKPLGGAVYLAQQGQNKFGSLLAIYLSIDDPLTGTVLKLPGKIESSSADGQLTASFEDNPQIPFETLRVNFFGGAHASLMTPPTCGTYTTTATLTPWSGTAPVNSSSSFGVTSGPNGAGCAPGFGPKLVAGTESARAGAYSPLQLRLSREDGSQRLSTVSVGLPRGLFAKLAGVPYCPDSALAGISGAEGTAATQIAGPACPAASRIGSVAAAAGAGPSPFFLDTGSAYLAGPYKGAPLSLAIVTPALAGPFDLGNVVVRAALQVDPETARVTAVTDPIPSILHGIPLDLREVRVSIDRPGFTVNPTNCAADPFSGEAVSTAGTKATLSSSFSAVGCDGLRFAPKLALSLRGKTNRGSYPALTAKLTAKPGEANIGAATVSLPHSEFLAQNHIGTVCTRPQFAAKACPARSIYGYAEARSPLLAQPLRGPVYLRANGGERELPDLVAALRGQVEIDLVGFIDSHKGGIRTRFATVPDAPITSFTPRMKGGKKSLLQNSTDLCAKAHRAKSTLIGQNGKRDDTSPPLAVKCPKR